MTQQVTVHKDQTHPKDALWWRPFFDMQQEIQKMMQSEAANLLTTPFMPPFIWNTEQQLFSKTQETMQRFMGELFNNRQMVTPWITGDNTEPYIDIIENDKGFQVIAELPGISSDNVDISLAEDAITIAGEKQETSTKKGDNYIRQECHHGAFSRTIALPDEADVEKASGEFEDGVLTVTIPKVADQPSKATDAKPSPKPAPKSTKPASRAKSTSKQGIRKSA